MTLKVYILAPLGEALLLFGEVLDSRPCGVVRSAFALEYLEYLVDFTVALEKWFPVGHFYKDTPCRPNIHTKVIPLLAHEYLRRSLPEGHHFVCQCL